MKKLFAVLVALGSLSFALAQSRTATLAESKVIWTDYRVFLNANGTADISACGQGTDSTGKVEKVCTGRHTMKNAARITEALSLGNGPALKLVKKNLGVGAGDLP